MKLGGRVSQAEAIARSKVRGRNRHGPLDVDVCLIFAVGFWTSH